MRAILMVVFGGALLCGCDDKDEQADTAEDTAVVGLPISCYDLTPELCADESTCAVIGGRTTQTTDEGICVDYSTETTGLGCMDAGDGCGAAETLAASPDDPETCWLFPTTCLPEGWTPCAAETWQECPQE